MSNSSARVIDTHVHFWDLNNDGMDWPSSENVVLYRNYLSSEFEKAMKDVDVEINYILVQVRQSYEETDWYLQLAEQIDNILGIVGWVDLKDEQLEKKLTEYKCNPYFIGVRHIVEGEEDLEWLCRPDVLRGLEILERLDVCYDLLITPKHFSIATEVMKKFPKLKVIVDHMAKPNMKIDDLEKWEDGLKALADLPNVYCKISGLADRIEDPQSKQENFNKYILGAVRIFGSKRCAFGSDWPVCTQGLQYEEWLSVVQKAIEILPQEAQNDILRDTASRFYGFRNEAALKQIS